VVVLTPVKNEAWILERFLAVTSTFADAIIVADQGSTDDSVAICRSFPKVHAVENPDSAYDEASRQRLLIETARRLLPGGSILLALDADEILAADAPESAGWREMLRAAPGTVLLFRKPDLYGSPHRCVRHPRPWPLGYVDDGAPHEPTRIHSIRLPQPAGHPRLEVGGAVVLHYALTRPAAQRAKMRLYSVLENVHETNHLLGRRRLYAPEFDWSHLGELEDSPSAWFEGWTARGIDMFTIERPRFTWHDHEALRLFARYGSRRFWLEPIWDLDWEACRSDALARGLDVPGEPVRRPPAPLRLGGRCADLAYSLWLGARRWLRRASAPQGAGR
jgi:hypothetical protein